MLRVVAFLIQVCLNILPAVLVSGQAFCQQVCIEVGQVDHPIQAVFGTSGQLLKEARPSIQLTLKPGASGWQRLYLYTRGKTPIRILKINTHSSLCAPLYPDDLLFAEPGKARNLPILPGATLLGGIEFDLDEISERYELIVPQSSLGHLLTNLDIYLEYRECGVPKRISIPIQACMW